MIIRLLTQANFNIFSFKCILKKASGTVKLPLYLSRMVFIWCQWGQVKWLHLLPQSVSSLPLRILEFVGKTYYFLFFGFVPQNTTFMSITINSTTAIDTQNPILSPSHSQVPKSVIHNSFQFILSTS